MEFDYQEQKKEAIIKVIGVGGGGSNAVKHMYSEGIKDVEFVICNTDQQALDDSNIPRKIHLGQSLTEGRGAGNKPDVGEEAARESIEEIQKILGDNTNMIFITAGMGGGTGTGAAPVIAEIAKDLGILTVGIVTIPFRNEGKRRINQAVDGIRKLEGKVDSLLVINNERIIDLYGDFPLSEAFAKADGVLATAAKGIAEIITFHGYINVDFADVDTVMRNSGVSIMGSGTSEGENRAIHAIEMALNSPLLNNNNINGAQNILLNITSSSDNEALMSEIDDITNYVQQMAGNNADLIWGNGNDDSLGEKLSVTVIATGFGQASIPELREKKPAPQSVKVSLNQQQPQYKEPNIFNQPPPQQQMPSNVPDQAPVRESYQRPMDQGYDLNNSIYQKERNEDAINQLYSNDAPAQPSNYQNYTQHNNPPYGQPNVQEPDNGMRRNFDQANDEEVDQMTRVPAYKRKEMLKQQQNNQAFYNQRPTQEYSQYHVDPNSNEPKINNNNSFLHDNVD
ncbi:cell division protein FtsZ [Halosquirtibacter xylanolyticus]|uniref:cell division protein FtsZ n=1 Tax=Halosquirtibacter xylanolyticus TaxID=3374599 RepID=UPI0037491561|nr:cell division protein FtsZ [Prolixibacteraceae bacterium]